MKSRVLILHTGGTLGMRPREPDFALAPDEFGPAVLQEVPELQQIAEVEFRVFSNLDSCDVTPALWRGLAEEIAAALPVYDGLVISHGTDAMAYTASALSFTLRELPCPVILTGSQRPLADPRSDARANLVGAVDLVSRRIPEVCIYFDGALLRGNRTTKRSSFAYAAYHSPNYPLLAEMGAGVHLHGNALQPTGPFRMEGNFDPRVAAVRLLPGQPAGPLLALQNSGLRGLLVMAFGAGNLPVVDRGVALALGRLTASGIVVAVGSQSPHGKIDLDLYAGGRLARAMGAVGIADMTIEAASVKLMYLLGADLPPAEVGRRLTLPIAGEVSGT